MSISSETRKSGPYDGNDSTTQFPFDFKVFAAADLQVICTVSGVETVKALTTDYTVVLNADQDSDPGGTVTMITPPATGETLTITSDIANTQGVKLVNLGGFYPTVINDALDRATIQIQQIDEAIGRSLKIPASTIGTLSTSLPAPEANKGLAWNGAADALINVTIPTNNNQLTNGAGYITGIGSSDVTTALGYTPENVANKGQPNGYASLDGSGLVPSSQLPSYVDDVEEYANLSSFPATGETGKLYIAVDTSKSYRWSGSTYVEIVSSPGSSDDLTEGTTNLFFTDARARAAISATGSLAYNSSTGVISYTAPSALSEFTNDVGFTTNLGTVTSVSGSGTVNGLSLTGTVTTSGSISLSGAISIDNSNWGAGDLSIANGGTGASTAVGARTNLGLEINTDIQAHSNRLDQIAGFTDPNADRILYWDDSAGTIDLLTIGTNLSITSGVLNATGGGGSGTVTSVTATGSVDGLTLTASGTTDVTVTLGGAVTGFLPLTGGSLTGDVDSTANIEAVEFIGDLRGPVLFKAQAGEALAKGDVVYISGISGNTTVVSKADANDANKMPAFGLAAAAANLNAAVDIYTFGTLGNLNTSGFTIGDTLYVGTTPGQLVNSPPAGESSLIQNIGRVTRVDASVGSIKIGGAGRTNATPNLNNGNVFIGNASNQAEARALNSSDITAALGYTPEDSANKGQNSGYASLDGTGKVPSSQLPSYVDDVEQYAGVGNFPATGETGKIYVDTLTNKVYRWSGSVYIEIQSGQFLPLAGGAMTGEITSTSNYQTSGGYFRTTPSFSAGHVTIGQRFGSTGFYTGMLMENSAPRFTFSGSRSNGNTVPAYQFYNNVGFTSSRTVDADVGINRTGSAALKISDGSSGFGSITASSLIRNGGTSSQFLKADGSVDSSAYITTYTVTQSDVTQHQAALSITESQISDLGNYSAVTSGAGAPSSTPTALGDIYIDTTNDDAYIAVGTASASDWEKSNDGTGTGGGGGTVTSVSGTGTVSGISLSGTVTTSGSLTLGGTLAADTSNITTGTFADARIAQSNVTQHQAALSITESQISDLGTYLTGNQTITLSGDVSGSGTTSIVVTVADDSHNHIISNVDGLQTALDAKAPLASPALTGTPTAPTAATATNTTQIATTAFVKAQGYLTSFTETNDLTAAVTWANVPNANITQSSVTQHQAALSITESQISDFGTYATLVGGVVPSSQLPSFVDDVEEYAGTGNFPATGETGKIYVDTSANKTYRWSGTQYVEISASPGSTDDVTEGSTNLYFTNARARAAISVSGSLSYDSGTGVISYTQPTNVSTFTNDSGYITASSTATLTNKSGNISQWTNDSGYLTSETSHADVVVDGDFASQGLMRRGATAGSYSIVTDNSANWNTAFGWGDHAAAGYVTASSTATFTNKSGNISQWTNDSGYTTNTGTVTSVGGTGTVNGITLSGTVTTSGNLSLGGSISGGLTGVTSVYNTGLAVGRSASTERIDFGTSGQIGVYLANVEEFRFAAGGTFHADADVVAFSTTVASDEKLKHNIHPITDALEKVQNLTGVTFQYRRDNKQSAGVIAQAVERVMPSAVKEVAHLNDEGTYKSVDYNQLIGLLIEAVKDQQQQIDKLRRMLGA